MKNCVDKACQNRYPIKERTSPCPGGRRAEKEWFDAKASAPVPAAAADRVEYAHFHRPDFAGGGGCAVHPLQPVCAHQHAAGGGVQPAAGGHLHRDQSGKRRCSFELGSHRQHPAPLSVPDRGAPRPLLPTMPRRKNTIPARCRARSCAFLSPTRTTATCSSVR